MRPRYSVHIQSGVERQSSPWLPPFLKRLSQHPPIVAGTVERTGGGYVEHNRKQLSCSGHHKWGPSLAALLHTTQPGVSVLHSPAFIPGSTGRAEQLRPNPAIPSLAERGSWISTPGGRLVTTNDRKLCDNLREKLYLTRSESSPLFSAAALRQVRVRSNPGPRRWTGSFNAQDLYRLRQFC